MRHRAVALGGQLHVIPAQRGTQIEVQLPLDTILAPPPAAADGTDPYWAPAARSMANPRSSEGRRK